MAAEITPIPATLPLAAGGAPLLRLVLAVTGTGMVLAALALWLVPGHATQPELLTIRLALSAFLGIGGLCALVGGYGRRV